MRPYDGGDGDTIMDGWHWKDVREAYPDYPDKPDWGNATFIEQRQVPFDESFAEEERVNAAFYGLVLCELRPGINSDWKVAAKSFAQYICDVTGRQGDMVRKMTQKDIAVESLQSRYAAPAIGAEGLGGVIFDIAFHDQGTPTLSVRTVSNAEECKRCFLHHQFDDALRLLRRTGSGSGKDSVGRQAGLFPGKTGREYSAVPEIDQLVIALMEIIPVGEGGGAVRREPKRMH